MALLESMCDCTKRRGLGLGVMAYGSMGTILITGNLKSFFFFSVSSSWSKYINILLFGIFLHFLGNVNLRCVK